ncbi:MAG: Na+/H+ antiporter subunit E [Clostridia bacterium]|jgi:multicomponent Na+:H+ antiporter subunit E|nr:Na+/H+ antiporter subunit E [Clostridia bacterium]
MGTKNALTKKAQFKQFVILPAALFIFWIVLSGKTDFKNLVIGLIAACLIPWLCRSVLCLQATTTPGKSYAAFDLPYGKIFVYLLWLFWELVKANIEVALIVLNPKMPINPQVRTFKKTLDHPVAQTVLAKSIILTPGTITIDVEDHVYTIHALTEGAALALAPEEGEGEMPARVGRLFNEEAEVK